MVKLDADNHRSLYLLNHTGEARLLLRTANPIIGCQFEPRAEQTLYCLKSDLVQTEDGKITEEPFLSIIDVKNAKNIPILALPNYRDVQMSMSPDGAALLFDQVVAALPNDPKALIASKGKAIADGRLWLFTLPELTAGKETSEVLPEELNPGFKPQWLP
jgi:hypothetical protein